MRMGNEVLVYESPQVETIEVEVEKGFAATGDGDAGGEGTDFEGGWN